MRCRDGSAGSSSGEPSLGPGPQSLVDGRPFVVLGEPR